MQFNKTVIYLALVGFGVGAFSIATAQDTGSDQTAQMEEVTVTGSRIKQRTEANSASPVTIISAEMIFDSGISNVEDLLQEMTASPYFCP